jgi:superfamily II DNA or RNA helicase
MQTESSYPANKKKPRRDHRPRGGSVTPTSSGLLVKFPFSPSRFEAIKKIPGCEYLAEEKAWLVPLAQAASLHDAPLFHHSIISYKDATEDVQQSIQLTMHAAQDALDRIRAQPFAVDEADIQAASVDIVVRFSNGLIIECKNARKRAVLLAAITGLLPLKPNWKLWCPIESLPELLTSARDNLFSFAVERETGDKLRLGKEARRSLLEGQHDGVVTPGLLRSLLFSPVAELSNPRTDRAETVSVHIQFLEQLEVLLPHASSRLQRQKLASGMSMSQFASCLFMAQQKGVRVWQDSLLQEALKQWHSNDRVAEDWCEGFLWCCNYPLWFGIGADGSPLLVVRGSAEGENLKRHLDAARAIGAIEITAPPETRFFRVPMRALLAVHKLFDEPNVALEVRETTRFQGAITEALRRFELQRRREWFHLSSDSSVSIQNQNLWNKLFPHQRLAVQWLTEYPASIIADDMGLGKTLSVLAAFDEMKQSGTVETLLVICPHSLLKNWERELAQWLPERHIVIVTSQSKAKRVAELEGLCKGHLALPDVIAINYEAARLDYVAPLLRELLGKHRMFLCLDESQRVKNSESVTFDELQRMSHAAVRRVLLSGTPAPRDLSDLWAQAYLVDHGERLGTNYRTWLKSVAEVGNKWGSETVLKWYPDQVEEVIARVREIMLRRRKEDVVNLPEKIFSVCDVQLEGDQAERYEQVRQELLVRVTSLTGKSFSKQVTDVMEEYLRAVQLASNPRLVDQSWEGEPAKFLALDQIVEQVVSNQNEKIVIWSSYRRNIEELAERYAKLGVGIYYGGLDKNSKDSTLTEFQNARSSMKVLIATPAAGGVGITLTAAQTAVYVEKNWNAEHYLQSIDRIHRIGQRGVVSIIALQACPIDIMIARNLEKKARLLRKIMDDGALTEDVANWRDELLSALVPVGGGLKI